jgi:hypothetical protein
VSTETISPRYGIFVRVLDRGGLPSENADSGHPRLVRRRSSAFHDPWWYRPSGALGSCLRDKPTLPTLKSQRPTAAWSGQPQKMLAHRLGGGALRMFAYSSRRHYLGSKRTFPSASTMSRPLRNSATASFSSVVKLVAARLCACSRSSGISALATEY